MRKCLGALLVALLVPASAFAEDATDVFGFQKFFKTKDGSYSWDSRHWADGNARDINWEGDPNDPTEWTDNRSAGDANPFFKIDGQGVMQMRSSGPRFHINSQTAWAQNKQFFLNVEYTGYYRRGSASVGGPDWGGMVVGVRSGPLGHASSGGNDCDASTYYARFRHDGKWDFEKEWKHPGSYYRSTSGIGHQDPLWGGSTLPVDKWIGMKYIVYNKDSSTVHLEVYIDSTTNATPPGKWELVGVAEDAGTDWSGASDGAATIDGCADYNGLSNAYDAILQGHGIVLMRTDGTQNNVVQGEYKFVSVREIDPVAPFGEEGGEEGPSAIRRTFRPSMENVPVRHFDLLGRPAEKDAPQRIYGK